VYQGETVLEIKFWVSSCAPRYLTFTKINLPFPCRLLNLYPVYLLEAIWENKKRLFNIPMESTHLLKIRLQCVLDFFSKLVVKMIN